MSADNREACIAVTLDFEGGNDDDPHDPGGRTSRGIIQSEWNAYRRAHSASNLPADVWKAPQSAVVDIYRTEYWNPVAGDIWPKGLDLVVYDAGVNSGIGKALTWSRYMLTQDTGTLPQLAVMGRAARDKVALIRRFCARRMSFLRALGTWSYFGRGWTSRVAGSEAIATKMALQAAGVPAPVVVSNMSATANTAGQKSNAAGGGAAAAPVAIAARATEHAHWIDYVITAGVVVVVLAVMLYLVHKWVTERARAEAFAKLAHDNLASAAA